MFWIAMFGLTYLVILAAILMARFDDKKSVRAEVQPARRPTGPR